MLRKATLSLLMLISVVVILPFANSAAHGLRQSSAYQQNHRYRRHSRAWWRRYRARMKMRRANTAAALAHRKAELGPVLSQPSETIVKGVLPALPAGWSNPVIANNGELRFRTEPTTGVPSQATLAVIARSRPAPAYLTRREQTRLLAGVAFSDLRRIVIDKMINSGGWVINDYERQVDGARVFVVIAQTPSDGKTSDKSWQFYFAEVEGKIYSLTLNTPLQFSDRLANEGEKFLSSLRAKRSEDPALKR